MKTTPLALAAALALTQPLTAAEKTNILFIMADDLGKESISSYGAEDIQTPHIDALAAGGMKFQNAYSMPQCTPSRVALLTGTYPWRNGWVNHWDVPRWGVGYFDPKQKRNTTVARLLKDAGYTTTAAGKWQINDFRIEPQAMKEHGFDDWLMWTGFETDNKPSAERYADPYVNTPQGSGTRENKFGPDLYTDHLIGFMKQNRKKPMFLYHAMCLPHTPFVATPDEPAAKSNLDKHKAMVRYLDKQVGRLVSAIDELGLRERTIIIFTTDNGSTGSIIGKAKESDREWIMAMGHGAARIDENGIRGVHDFSGRVIRDKRFKVWVNTGKKIDRLHDLKDDPWEEKNLLDGELDKHQMAALRKFQAVVDSLPDKDARPLYEPRAPDRFDEKERALSRVSRHRSFSGLPHSKSYANIHAPRTTH